MASTMAPSAAAMEVSESRSVGIGPDGGAAPAPPGRIGTPHERQTCAQEGFERPQLKQSTVSPVIAAEPSMQARRHGPCIHPSDNNHAGGGVGKVLLGVLIGVILVIWLLAACVSNLF